MTATIGSISQDVWSQLVQKTSQLKLIGSLIADKKEAQFSLVDWETLGGLIEDYADELLNLLSQLS